jgi:hypothetical protein
VSGKRAVVLVGYAAKRLADACYLLAFAALPPEPRPASYDQRAIWRRRLPRYSFREG